MKKTKPTAESQPSVLTSKPKGKTLPQYFQDRLIPPLDESKLSQEELEEHKKRKAKALEVRTWAKGQIEMMEVARNTPPSDKWRCKQQVA